MSAREDSTSRTAQDELDRIQDVIAQLKTWGEKHGFVDKAKKLEPLFAGRFFKEAAYSNLPYEYFENLASVLRLIWQYLINIDGDYYFTERKEVVSEENIQIRKKLFCYLCDKLSEELLNDPFALDLHVSFIVSQMTPTCKPIFEKGKASLDKKNKEEWQFYKDMSEIHRALLEGDIVLAAIHKVSTITYQSITTPKSYSVPTVARLLKDGDAFASKLEQFDGYYRLAFFKAAVPYVTFASGGQLRRAIVTLRLDERKILELFLPEKLKMAICDYVQLFEVLEVLPKTERIKVLEWALNEWDDFIYFLSGVIQLTSEEPSYDLLKDIADKKKVAEACERLLLDDSEGETISEGVVLSRLRAIKPMIKDGYSFAGKLILLNAKDRLPFFKSFVPYVSFNSGYQLRRAIETLKLDERKIFELLPLKKISKAIGGDDQLLELSVVLPQRERTKLIKWALDKRGDLLNSFSSVIDLVAKLVPSGELEKKKATEDEITTCARMLFDSLKEKTGTEQIGGFRLNFSLEILLRKSPSEKRKQLARDVLIVHLDSLVSLAHLKTFLELIPFDKPNIAKLFTAVMRKGILIRDSADCVELLEMLLEEDIVGTSSGVRRDTSLEAILQKISSSSLSIEDKSSIKRDVFIYFAKRVAEVKDYEAFSTHLKTAGLKEKDLLAVYKANESAKFVKTMLSQGNLVSAVGLFSKTETREALNKALVEHLKSDKRSALKADLQRYSGSHAPSDNEAQRTIALLFISRYITARTNEHSSFASRFLRAIFFRYKKQEKLLAAKAMQQALSESPSISPADYSALKEKHTALNQGLLGQICSMVPKR